MKWGGAFMRHEGGFTTPAAALAVLVALALVLACTRGIAIGSRSGQIQYVADAGALAADGVIAEFVTAGQVVDASALSLSLLGLTVYAVSAVTAFIPGAQGAAAEIAHVGSKVFETRDRFVDSAIRGLDAAQKALPALCALRSGQVIQANADASGIPYAGAAITVPIEGIDISIPDDSQARQAAHEIESKEESVQQASVAQQEAQQREDAARKRAWQADCGNEGMSMFERAAKLSSISGAKNPYFSSPDNWSFSVALNRAVAYYQARYASEPGAYASGSPERVGESIARKQFYAYALNQVSSGRIETSASGSEVPHLVQLARNTAQIRETSLYTDCIYPTSINGETRTLHAWTGCPEYAAGSPSGSAAVCDIDSGACQSCPTCRFSATTLGRVPSASTSISNGFEYHYLALVEASRDYAQAIEDRQAARQELDAEREEIGSLLSDAARSLAGKRYDPQPPGCYGCICVVVAPGSSVQGVPFLHDEAAVPARIAMSAATLAPDAADDAGNVIADVAQGLVPSESLLSGPVKTVFGAWGSVLKAYVDGSEGLKSGFRKTLGAIPVVGTTLSDAAVSTFETALATAGIEPADLDSYKPVLVNTSYVLERGGGAAADVIGRLKLGAQMYGAISMRDLDALVADIESVPEIGEFLDEHGLEIARIPLADIGLGTGDGSLYLPVPDDIDARLEDVLGRFGASLGG